MPFSISADLPLGVYRGHGSDGRPERLPSVARLHSALLCAAGFGPRARQDESGLSPDTADEAALRWLEDNPPDTVAIPALQVNVGRATAYRDDGTVKRANGVATVNRPGKPADASVAVGGAFTWTWSEAPPPEVASALEALCPDVAHLGTAETPVRLSTHRAEAGATHLLDREAGLFTTAGEDLDLPATGRVDELVAAHRATLPVPTVRQDAPTGGEKSSSPVPPRDAVRPARYVPVRRPSADAPWPEVIVLPLDEQIPENLRVRWAVAAHRALIRSIGFGAPPLLTGTYPEGDARPANRIGLHLLDPSQPVDLVDRAPAELAVLLPRDAPHGDVGVVLGALRGLTSLRGPGGWLRRVTDQARLVPGDAFWREPPPGTVRLWRTCPAAVPDTRGSGPEWTFAHAALLSLGFVWQGSSHLPRVPGRGGARDQRLVAAVNEAGAAVLAVEPLRSTNVTDYVHRVHEHAVVRPYRATLTTGGLGGARTIQAIGQARHLGGGLLVPVDVPEGSRLDEIGGLR